MEAKEKQIRKCIITGKSFNKADMTRLVSFRKGDVEIDLSGKKEGRGCYISLNPDNIDKLLEKNGALLARSFRKQITPKELESLKENLPKAMEEKKFRPRSSKPIVLRIKREDLPK